MPRLDYVRKVASYFSGSQPLACNHIPWKIFTHTMIDRRTTGAKSSYRHEGNPDSQFPITPFHRWDEKAGLRRDAICSQRLTRSRRNGKETGLCERIALW